MSRLRHLTEKQYQVLEYILKYMTLHETAPLIREIQEGCRITTYKSAIDRLNALERKGFIKRMLNKHRGIHVLKQVPQATSEEGLSPSFQGVV